jgi:hypothetical protein
MKKSNLLVMSVLLIQALEGLSYGGQEDVIASIKQEYEQSGQVVPSVLALPSVRAAYQRKNVKKDEKEREKEIKILARGVCGGKEKLVSYELAKAYDGEFVKFSTVKVGEPSDLIPVLPDELTLHKPYVYKRSASSRLSFMALSAATGVGVALLPFQTAVLIKEAINGDFGELDQKKGERKFTKVFPPSHTYDGKNMTYLKIRGENLVPHVVFKSLVCKTEDRQVVEVSASAPQISNLSVKPHSGYEREGLLSPSRVDRSDDLSPSYDQVVGSSASSSK